MRTLSIDRYVLETLMPELVGQDRRPVAFALYLHLWTRTFGAERKSVRVSHHEVASELGVSKSAVQAAVKHLTKRRLLRTVHASRTAVPEYFPLRPWAERGR
jgi:replication initiation and membrane attachment protein DnaB